MYKLQNQINRCISLQGFPGCGHEGGRPRHSIACKAVPQGVQHIDIVRDADVLCSKARTTGRERCHVVSPSLTQARVAGSGADESAFCDADVGHGDHCRLEGDEGE